MKDNKALVVIAAVIILVAFLAVLNFAPKNAAEPEALTGGSTTMTVDTTPALELESYQDTVDAYDLQPATTIR